MSSFNLTELRDQLSDSDSQSGVSFAKKSLKLDSEEDAAEVVKAIQTCSRLEYLDLEGNTLGPHAARALAEVLKKKGTHLKRALWKDMFTGRLKTEIPKALESLGDALSTAGTTLVELDLSDNAFGPIGVQGLANFLSSSVCYTLQELRLNNNGLGIAGGKMLAKALSDCYDNSFKAGSRPLALKVFHAGRNRLENEGAKALASVFSKLTSLEEVSMPQNGIYHVGVAALAKGLSSNTSLRILNLNDNTVGPKGAQALAEALPNFQNLENLDLGDCLLETKGALVLAGALGVDGSHVSLSEVNFSYNEIRTRAAEPIARAMQGKKSLTSLQMGGNALGTKGRVILEECLTNSDKIEALNILSDNDTEDEEEEEGENEEGEEEVEEEEEEEEEDVDDDDDDNDEEEDDEDEDDDDDDDDDDEDEGDDETEKDSGRRNTEKAKSSIEGFLSAATGEKLLLLPDSSVQGFVEHAKKVAENSEISVGLKFAEEFTRIIMKVSSFCGSGYVDVRVKAEKMTDALYAELFEFALKNDQISALNNALLVNLGLIKCEDKKAAKIDWALEGCFKALEKVSWKEYFPSETKETLKIFLDRPVRTSRSKAVDSFEESKESLRAVLHEIRHA